jgi:hypothetical protein
MQLEKTGSKSPLLGEPVIERDYTKSIEGQFNGGQQSRQTEPQSTISEDPFAEPSASGQSGFSEPSATGTSGFEGPKGFEFDQEMHDASDVGEGDAQEGFQLDSMSAKSFANIIGDIVKSKVPELSYNYVKVDINNIVSHINSGNIHPDMKHTFEQVNEQVLIDLQFKDEEIKMWKKALAAYMEYKNIRSANPETAFILATATLIITHLIKMRQIKTSINKLVYDVIKSYNPAYFDSYAAKTNKAPENSESTETNKAEAETKTNSKKSL